MVTKGRTYLNKPAAFSCSCLITDNLLVPQDIKGLNTSATFPLPGKFWHIYSCLWESHLNVLKCYFFVSLNLWWTNLWKASILFVLRKTLEKVADASDVFQNVSSSLFIINSFHTEEHWWSWGSILMCLVKNIAILTKRNF